jgi:hypothetical protein
VYFSVGSEAIQTTCSMYEGRSGQAAVPPAPARKTGPDVPAGRAQDVWYIAYSPPEYSRNRQYYSVEAIHS